MKDKNNIDKLIILLKTKYISLINKFISYEEVEEVLEKFIDFFHIKCSNKGYLLIKKIEFKNEIIKNYFNKQFSHILCNIINTNDLKIFNDLINKSIEGILLEKQIILALIATMSFKKLKIDKIIYYGYDKDIMNYILIIKSHKKYYNRIYYINNLPKDFKLNKGEKIIIVQENENAPIYDFSIITYYNNELILKIYQVDINKDNTALIKLDMDKISVDIEYFVKKLKTELKIDIKYYSFGIITSKKGYDLYIDKKTIKIIKLMIFMQIKIILLILKIQIILFVVKI